MTKIVLTFGLIAGVIVGAMFFIMHPADGEINFDGGQVAGYISMLIALSTIFFAVRQYRDKHMGGRINFGKSFMVGLYVTLIAALVYVLAWEVYQATSDGDFGAQYMEWQKESLAEKGKTAEEIAAKVAKTEKFMNLYDNNAAVRMAMTSIEIIPVGLLISLISAFFFGYWQNRNGDTKHLNFDEH